MEMLPDPPADTPPSLVDGIGRALRGGRRARSPVVRGGDWRFGAALALLLPAPLLATWIVAEVAARSVEADTQATRARVAVPLAARRIALADRALLAQAAAVPAIAPLANGLARVLPADARIAMLSAAADGTVAAEVATPDPDALRSALRRDPATARLRDVGQRQGDAAIIVQLREPAR